MMASAPEKTRALSTYPNPFADANQSPRAVPRVCETAAAIQSARAKGVLAVEMEAAALYAFAKARSASVLCLAHVTNTMAQNGADFEKGEDDGTVAALAVLGAIIGTLAEGIQR